MIGARAVKVPMLALLSLIGTASGVLVDMLMARTYGTSPVVDAYRATSLFLTFGVQLCFGQAMLNVVLGLLTRRADADPAETILALRRVAGMALVLLAPVAVVTLLAAAHAEAVLRWTTPGLAPAVATLGLPMVRAFLPMLVPLLVIGITWAVLQFYGRFWLAAVYRLALNALLILLIWLAGDGDDGRALVASQVAATVAVAVLSLALLAFVRQDGRRLLLAMLPPRIDRAMAASFRLAGGPLSLNLTSQLFGFVLLYALSRQPPGAIAEYAYASKFLSLTDVLPQAVTAILFPNLVALWIDADRVELTRLVARALCVVGTAAALCGLVLAIAGPSMVDLLLAHGRLSASDGLRIAQSIAVLAIGAPAAAFSQILLPLCYATGRQWRPLVISAGQVLLLALLVPLIDGRGLLGVVAVFTVQIIVATGLLFLGAVRSGLAIGGPVWASVVRLLPCLVGTGVAVELARWSCGVFRPETELQQLIDLVVIGLISPLAFYGLARLVGLREIESVDALLGEVRRRLGRFLRA